MCFLFHLSVFLLHGVVSLGLGAQISIQVHHGMVFFLFHLHPNMTDICTATMKYSDYCYNEI